MRTTFASTLEEQANLDKKIVLLTADMGFSVFETFRKKFPDRFFNVGISEQNMIGLAAGLALAGKKVFVYSIIPFVTFRCLEQIRNDLCYQDLPVVVVGVGSGVSYGAAGFSHHALEDIGALKSIPNIVILAPSDPSEVRQLVIESCKYKHPVYLRLGKNNEKTFNFSNRIKIGGSYYIRKGKKVALVTCGNVIEEVMEAYERLKASKIIVSVVSVPTIKPLDASFFKALLKAHKHVFIIEEHNIFGGLGDSIFNFNKNNLNKNDIYHIAFNDKFVQEIGDNKYLRKISGLDANSIYNKVLIIVKNKGA